MGQSPMSCTNYTIPAGSRYASPQVLKCRGRIRVVNGVSDLTREVQPAPGGASLAHPSSCRLAPPAHLPEHRGTVVAFDSPLGDPITGSGVELLRQRSDAHPSNDACQGGLSAALLVDEE
jgi:hypothetical protein